MLALQNTLSLRHSERQRVFTRRHRHSVYRRASRFSLVLYPSVENLTYHCIPVNAVAFVNVLLHICYAYEVHFNQNRYYLRDVNVPFTDELYVWCLVIKQPNKECSAYANPLTRTRHDVGCIYIMRWSLWCCIPTVLLHFLLTAGACWCNGVGVTKSTLLAIAEQATVYGCAERHSISAECFDQYSHITIRK